MADKKKARTAPAFSPETLNDITRSGLDAHDAKLMGIVDVDAEWCDENLDIPRAGYRIPYPGFDFYRIRFTQFTKPQRVNGKVYTLDEIRYTQPQGTRPYPYLSPHVTDWPGIFKDPSKKITFTEGEKKAAKACKEGITCVGLGGVWNFKSTGRGWTLLPELAEVVWQTRHVEICYDSDVMTKREVFAALMELTNQLVERGASVAFVYLTPSGDEKKIGLDDYLVKYGLESYLKIPRETSRLSMAFETLNRRACYLTRMGKVWDFQTYTMMDRTHARDVLAPLAKIFETRGRGVNAQTIEVPAFDAWMNSPFRLNAEALVYEPGNRLFITPERNVNLWIAPEVRARRGVVREWLDFITWIFGDARTAAWFLKWLAYPIQHPGTKLYQAVYMWGAGQGIGKSFVITPLMEHIYGPQNFSRINNESLESTFNSDIVNKQFALLDECFLAGTYEKQKLMGKLKNMVTREKATSNDKYQRMYVVRDCVNYYITTNHEESLPLDMQDRRFLVVKAPDEALPKSTYAKLDAWLRDVDDLSKPGVGVSAVLHHLQYKIDCSDFDPKGPALVTDARTGVIEIGMNHYQEFCYKLAHNPYEIEAEIRANFMTITDLQKFYMLTYPGVAVPTLEMLAREINKYSKKIPKRRVEHQGRRVMLWCIKDAALYKDLPPAKWAGMYFTRQTGGIKGEGVN